MTTATNNCSHPLQGIVSTNDDPTRCAFCPKTIDTFRNNGFTLCCCGKMVCIECVLKGATPTGGFVPCELCHGNRTSIKALKKHAKRGSAWAQFGLGAKYETGGSLTLSYEDARLWYTKAARQNHPDALHNLGCLYKKGVIGGGVDLEKARDLVLSAMRVDPENKLYASTLVKIAECYLLGGVVDEWEGAKQALDILVPLAGTDPETSNATTETRFHLAYALFSRCAFQASYDWYCSTVLVSAESLGGTDVNGESFADTATFNAMLCCRENRLGLKAQMIFWARLAKNVSISLTLDPNERLDRTQKIVEILRAARILRDTCGGCGAAFEGKERKFCRGCKAFCYCSRECQKVHWNRKKDGHREDCKGAMELKRKLKEAKMDAAMKK